MVFKRSEYRREYKTQSLVKNVPTYYDNLTYRNHRRELEYAHTPISWDSESDSNDTTHGKETKDESKIPRIETLILTEPGCTKKPDPVIELITEKQPDKAENKPVEEKQIVKLVEDAKAEDTSIQKQSPEEKQLKKDAKEKLVKYTFKENKDNPEKSQPKLVSKSKLDDLSSFKPQKVGDKTFVSKAKVPVQNQASKSTPSARPKTAPPTRQSERLQSRPPFLPYGCGDSERVTGTQRSHNVHASTDVYPAALKAHERLVEAARRRKDASVKAAKLAKKRRRLIREKLAHDALFWKSEYGFKFPAYACTEYAKNCERPKRCKSAFGHV